jgi:apolipoprotein N-acyltransferase
MLGNPEFMLTRRQLPRTTLICAITVVAGFALFAGLIVWIVVRFGCDWLIALPFVIALPVGSYFFCARRCPECGSRLAYRREMLGETTEYRWLARCDHCQIDWDTGIFDDTEHSAS